MTPYTPTPNEVISRLRKGETLAQMASDMALLPDLVYSEMTKRRGHSQHLEPGHRTLEAKTLRRIWNKRILVQGGIRYAGGTVRLEGDGNPYEQTLTSLLSGSLIEAAEAHTESTSLAATPDLSEEWRTLEYLAAMYCHPIPRKKKGSK